MSFDYPKVYINEPPPTNPDNLAEFLDRQLRLISIANQALNEGVIDPVNVEPTNKRDGMIRYADGTDWNPGSGEGFYGYENGAWVKL